MKHLDLLKQRKVDKDAAQRLFDFGKIVLTVVGDVAEAGVSAFWPHPYYHSFCKHREHSFRSTLSRLHSKGLIARAKDTNKFFVLTDKGQREYKKILTRLLYEQKKEEEWDKKWRILIFDIPEKYKKHREFLRRELVDYDFFPLQKSVWVSPYRAAEELKQILEDHGLDRWVRLMVVDVLFDDIALRKKFKL